MFSCAGRKSDALIAHYRAETSGRLNLLLVLRPGDSATLNRIHRESENILLISKDSENPEAAAKRSAMLLDEICTVYSFRRIDFTDITAGMQPEELELQLLENELAIYNRLVLETDTGGIIFSAH